jgi:hypothetical protein
MKACFWSMVWPRALLLFVALVAAAGCERPFPPRPLPGAFAVRGLDGQSITPAEMRGTPWLVNLWLPG